MVDFSACIFINEQMKFYTYLDFCENRKILKQNYKKLTKDAQLFYMWYVYANTHIDLRFKNVIWDYLNDYASEQHLINLLKFYKIK